MATTPASATSRAQDLALVSAARHLAQSPRHSPPQKRQQQLLNSVVDARVSRRRVRRSTSDSGKNHRAGAPIATSVSVADAVCSSNSRRIAPKRSNSTQAKSVKHLPSPVPAPSTISKSTAAPRMVPISKSHYTRPVHPKVKCPYCSEYPDGFRGDHELKRHVDRKHSTKKKVWVVVCDDNSANKSFLSWCKHCRGGKQYNIDYNAAAHLRRAHFHPRRPGSRGSEERRAGKGGGDEPSMAVLKNRWLREVEIDATPDLPADSPDDSSSPMSSPSLRQEDHQDQEQQQALGPVEDEEAEVLALLDGLDDQVAAAADAHFSRQPLPACPTLTPLSGSPLSAQSEGDFDVDMNMALAATPLFDDLSMDYDVGPGNFLY